MHSQIVVMPDGMEAVFPGADPYTTGGHEPVIADWITYGIGMASETPVIYGASADYIKNIFANRDRHYSDPCRSIEELKSELQGKRFLIACPGPSLSACLGSCELPEDVVLIAINKAVGCVRLDLPNRYAMIMERNAKPEWLRTGRDFMAPWVPDCRLITVPESSEWLADLWPVENRFYCNVYWHNVPKDGRDRFPLLLTWYITPVLAMDFARYMGASKIILAGCDMSLTMNGMYYYDTHHSKHPNAQEHATSVTVRGIDGELCQTTPSFMFQRNCLEAVAYWIERSARIPVLNATGAGILDWRPTALEEALHGEHEPTVDYFSGEISEHCASEDLHGHVEAPAVQGAVAVG